MLVVDRIDYANGEFFMGSVVDERRDVQHY